ncbi:hypothetical protein AB4371_16710 [Vibrio sp. 10N.261.51.A3]|uniref:hypothetical protein n=1 Tax=Vibrio sp. 10N.261.51.A3 TaxID=3229673 RepID=UPI00354F225B
MIETETVSKLSLTPNYAANDNFFSDFDLERKFVVSSERAVSIFDKGLVDLPPLVTATTQTLNPKSLPHNRELFSQFEDVSKRVNKLIPELKPLSKALCHQVLVEYVYSLDCASDFELSQMSNYLLCANNLSDEFFIKHFKAAYVNILFQNDYSNFT